MSLTLMKEKPEYMKNEVDIFTLFTLFTLFCYEEEKRMPYFYKVNKNISKRLKHFIKDIIGRG